jgi:aminoglycoside phosphotransferase (APT) family kinase protein
VRTSRTSSSTPHRRGASADEPALLAALAGEVDEPATRLVVVRRRLAGRSSITVVAVDYGQEPQPRWLVKQPHTDWAQDDLDNPVTAEEEFAALTRLDEHFRDAAVPWRVPRPVALLPGLGGLAMEFVRGRTLKELLYYKTALRPEPLLGGLASAGQLLRHVHGLEEPAAATVDLRDEACAVLEVAAERLAPLGLSIPERVARTLHEVPSVRVQTPHVRLHGDFGPANVLLAEDGSTVVLDPALLSVGTPEEELVRFVALMSGAIRFAPELAVRPLSAVRHHLEHRLLDAYYGEQPPLLLELKYQHQLVRRWCRLRELAQQHERPALLPLRLTLVARQMRALLLESEHRLRRRI